MRIGLDVRFLAQPGTGVHRYLTNLLHWLPRLAPEHEYFLYWSPASGMKPEPSAPTCHWRPIPGPHALFSFAPSLWRAIAQDQLDVFHGTAYTLPWRTPCAAVLTVHDVTFEVHPGWSRGRLARWFRVYIRRSVRRAKRVIADSEATRQDILRFYRISPERVVTIHLGGAEPSFFQRDQYAAQQEVKSQLGIEAPFLLYVGALHERKNVRRLIEAYARARQTGAFAHALLIVGSGSAQQFDTIRGLGHRLRLGEHLQLRPPVSAAQLPLVYAAADAFVYPSVYEGFGLPVIEAMACGTAVVTSRSSSLAEVAGEAAILIEPTDVDALASAITAVLTDQGLRSRLAARGLDQARRFSWEACARSTNALYQTVHTESR